MTVHVRNLGTLMATSRGDGLYARGVRKTVPLTIVATVDDESVERNPDGSIDFAMTSFQARFSAEHWDADALGIMYTDGGIRDSVNAYLGSLGFAGRVGWSEHGRQEDGIADFDMQFALADELWPGLRHDPDRVVPPTELMRAVASTDPDSLDADAKTALVRSWLEKAARWPDPEDDCGHMEDQFAACLKSHAASGDVRPEHVDLMVPYARACCDTLGLEHGAGTPVPRR